ncbi:6-phosphogluconolactonase [Pantoea sp. Aalb]|uniref:6-phosphogluconolactonase n=1 Tax=Pantoea sp. Aalb TaxID=2576762 RepID=UPI001322D297|nr:6-phosphogluconolactonase [Pantoea sp. Aalb]MXP67521.1 6-phosphogluconolactonase [Pantoea sp. Aalb]
MKQIVYVASPISQQIHVWLLKKNGELILLQILDVDGQVQPMVVHPKKNILYIGIRPIFRILSYYINIDGTLRLSSEVRLPGSPTHISTDRLGNYLFCASYNSSCISMNPINNVGKLTKPSQIINDLEGCHSVNIDLNNKILFVPVLKQDRICLFELNYSGKLLPYKQSQVNTAKGAGPRCIVFHPNNKYAYSVNELNSTVDVWILNNDQYQVECLQTVDIMPRNFFGKRWAADIHITSDGRFLYTCDRTSNILSVFKVNNNGDTLTIQGFQSTEIQPRGFNIDYNGHYLLSAGQKSDHITVYKIQKNGLLIPLERYTVGKGPMWITIHQLN